MLRLAIAMFLQVYRLASKFLFQTLDLSNFSVCNGDAAVFGGRRQRLMKLGIIDYYCMRLEGTSEIQANDFLSGRLKKN